MPWVCCNPFRICRDGARDLFWFQVFLVSSLIAFCGGLIIYDLVANGTFTTITNVVWPIMASLVTLHLRVVYPFDHGVPGYSPTRSASPLRTPSVSPPGPPEAPQSPWTRAGLGDRTSLEPVPSV